MNTIKKRYILGATKIFAIAFLPILLFFFCSKDKETSLYRFIDHFSQESILLSPFVDMASDPEGFKEKNPNLYDFVALFPLLDFGVGENPYLIKKKLKIGPVEINTLLAPPKSHYQFPVKVPVKSFLEFTYGIRRDAYLFNQGAGKRQVSFTILIKTKEGREELFSKSLVLDARKDLEFNYKKIDLAKFGGKDVTIYFQTRGDNKALACWFNPVIYVPQQETRNVILISLDTLRADHLSCYGYERETSPNIDLLAKDSALFLNTFASSPWTLPSHVSLMTSLDCINHKVYHGDQKINPEIKTLADFLRSAGYLNVAFTGGGYVSGIFGFNKGFDSYQVRGDVNAPGAVGIVAEAALNWIEEHKDRNFFLFLHTYQIHTPYSSPAPYNELFLDKNANLKEADMGKLRLNHEYRYKPLPESLRQNIIALYDAEIRYTDEALIKPLLDLLKNLQLYDNTMILLTSDHGEEFYEHKSWEHNHSLYNETIKVPLIIKFFQSKHAGQRIHKYTRLTDPMPTILDELKINHSKNYMDGESVLTLLTGREKGEERIFLAELASDAGDCRIPKKVAMNQGKNKLISNEEFPPEFLSYFKIPPHEGEKLEIYNLENDSEEERNVVTQNSTLTRELLNFFKINYIESLKIIPQKTKINKEIQEQLRALGYIK